MKPLWFVEKDIFGWTVNCLFILGDQKAGLSQLISPREYYTSLDKPYLLAETIQHINCRREKFIAEELNHA